jgi:hypothetical protein
LAGPAVLLEKSDGVDLDAPSHLLAQVGGRVDSAGGMAANFCGS